jgi:alkylation response protein AidB-like acyl-CoA dehydrogenase
MNFTFTEEQTQLRAALQRQLERSYSFDKRKEIVGAELGYSAKVWQQLAELGALAVALGEEDGGTGGDAVDTLVVSELLGRYLVVEPYLATVVLGAGLVRRAGTPGQRALLPTVAAGRKLLALAHEEPDSRYQLSYVTTRARRDGDGFVLDGDKVVVLGGAAAELLIVSARSDGEAGDRGGVTLWLVDAATAGITRRSYRTQDSQRAADVTLRGVRVTAAQQLGAVGDGVPQVERAYEYAIAAACGEALGAMTALLELTSSYVKTRQQFGVPIGQFQVLQHRLADMLMRVEQARSMTYLAAATVDSPDAASRRRALAAAKVVVSQAARFVGQQAVQSHGAIGMTEEAPVSHYFKRLTMLSLLFGDADHHLGQFSDSLLER